MRRRRKSPGLSQCDAVAHVVDLSPLEHVSSVGWDIVVLYGQYILDLKARPPAPTRKMDRLSETALLLVSERIPHHRRLFEMDAEYPTHEYPATFTIIEEPRGRNPRTLVLRPAKHISGLDQRDRLTI